MRAMDSIGGRETPLKVIRRERYIYSANLGKKCGLAKGREWPHENEDEEMIYGDNFYCIKYTYFVS